MKIDIACSDPAHPVWPHLRDWAERARADHDCTLIRTTDEMAGGDILFLISFHQIVGPELRSRYRHVLVVHASDLPKGRGWSPHIWALLEGAEALTVTLLSAEDGVDTGPIWAKRNLPLAPHLLHDEIAEHLFEVELDLLDTGVAMITAGQSPTPQSDDEATYYPRRRPADSQIDPTQTLEDAFRLLRVCDPDRYPAFFELHGHKYTIHIKKVSDNA